MTRNLPCLQEVAGDPGRLTSLSLDALDALLAECEQTAKTAASAKKAIVSHLERAYGGDIAHAYASQEKDFGTVRLFDGGYEIVVDTPKRTEWDQAALAAAREKIVAAGDDPSEYLEVSYSVPERKYAA